MRIASLKQDTTKPISFDHVGRCAIEFISLCQNRQVLHKNYTIHTYIYTSVKRVGAREEMDSKTKALMQNEREKMFSTIYLKLVEDAKHFSLHHLLDGLFF